MQCSVEVFGLFLYFPSCVHVLGDSCVASEEVDSLVAAIRVNLKECIKIQVICIDVNTSQTVQNRRCTSGFEIHPTSCASV